MPTTTGIELGPESCVLAGVRAGRLNPEVCSLAVVGPSVWPGHGVPLADMLRSIRRQKKMPRSARVVAWRLPEGAHPDDPVARAALRPLVAAGFRIDALLSPAQALTQLAGLYPPGSEGATAWLALNMSSAAIAIVRGADLLFSRTFEWSFQQAPSGSRAELLQRYSFVAHLAPEVQHGVATVEAAHGIRVGRVVTCGDLPDLRSLTMPLIEELDLEVETLDSAQGLRAAVAAKVDRLSDVAPAIRLAWAAATAPSQRQAAVPLARVAAAAVLLAGLGWLAYAAWTPSPGPARIAVSPAPPPTDRVETPPQAVRRSPGPFQGPPVQGTSGSPEQSQAGGAVQASRGHRSGDADAEPARPAPVLRTAPPVQAPALPPGASSPGAVQAPAGSESPATPPGQVSRASERPRAPAALKEPLPVVDSILIDRNRRLAVIGRSVVAVGDRVGPRTVARIEPDFVELREPSGLLVRVPIRWRGSWPETR